MVTGSLLTVLRERLTEEIATGRFKTSAGMECTVDVQSVAIETDGRVSANFLIEPSATSGDAITHVELCASDGSTLVSKDEYIARAGFQDSIVYRFFISIDEA